MTQKARKTACLSIALATCSLLLAGRAQAQDEPTDPEGAEPPAKSSEPLPPGTPPPKIDVGTPEPEAAPPPRTYHVHDGFYLRMSIGYGAYGVRYDNDVHATSGAFGFDLLVGGSPSPGVAIGGMLLSDFLPNASLKQGDRSFGDVNVETGLIGPFIDGFPDPKGGFHLGGMVGLGSIRSDAKSENSAASLALGTRNATRTDAGFGGTAFVGYDAWVGDEWSVGGLLRFAAAFGRSKENGNNLDSRSTSLTLMFTALYH